MKLKLNLTGGLLLAVALTHFLTTSSLWASGACTAARFNDWKSSGCHQVPGGNQSVCTNCNGMPRWWIEEPYINLHLADTPLNYKASSGQEMAFTFNYKQRYELPPVNQCFNAYYVAQGLYSGRLGLNDAETTIKRSAGYINAAWAHNWMMDITFWDAQWEAGSYHPPAPAPSVSASSSVFNSNYEALVISPSGAVDYLYNSIANGASLSNPNSQAGLIPLSGQTNLGFNYPTVSTNLGFTNGIYWGNTTNGFKMVYADGSQDVFGLAFFVAPNNSYESTAHALLTQRIDPQGRVTKVGYEFTSAYKYPNGTPYGAYRVKYVVDSDLRTNTFMYNSTGGIKSNAWQVTEIDDPYGRKATFTYESGTAWLSSITDAASNSSSFSYQNYQTTNFWLYSLTTPYGTTGFTFDQTRDSTSTNLHDFTGRAALVREPEGAGQLFYYLHQATSAAPASTQSPTNIPGVTDLDDGTPGTAHYALTYRDSFHWDRRQFQALSTGVTNYLNSGDLPSALGVLSGNDFLKGRLSHWLLTPSSGPDVIDDGISLTELISAERDPSPDAAGLIPGLWTWYDYANKTSRELAGDAEVTCVAQLLPDGTSQYTRYHYYSGPVPLPGLVSDSETSVTLTNGTLGELTNWFRYAANSIDLTNVSNSIGQVTSYVFNTSHQITSLTNAVHETTSFTWNSATHNLTLVSLPNGETLTPTYYPTNSTSHPLSNNTAFIKQIDIEPQGRLININDYSYGLPRLVQISGTGLTTLLVTNFWDGLNRLTGTAFPDNSASSNVYTALSLTAQKDRLANWTSFVYDGLEHLKTITDARMGVTTLSWCGCGSLTSITDATLTNTTTYSYDNQTRLTQISFPDTSSLNYQYDLNGRTTYITDGSGRSVQLGHNNQGLVTRVSNTYGPLRQTVYDLVNRPVKITDANNVTITNGYDAINRLLARVWTSDGLGESFVYATNGLVSYTDRNQKVTLFLHDQASRVVVMTNADLHTTQFGYDAANHLTSLTNGLGNTTLWNYNEYGRVTSETDATNRQIFLYTYDANGRLTNRWTLGTTNTAYAYDAVGNLTNIVYSNAPTVAIGFAYDADNRLTSMRDAVGTSGFTYTATGQLLTETGPWTSNTLTYGYTQGHRTSLSLLQPAGGAWSQTYGYDPNQWRLTGLASPAGAFTYGYPASASALIQSLSLPNTAGVAYQYDALARLTNTALANYWGQTLDGYSYGLDPLGQRTNLVRNLGLTASSVKAAYDNIGQLISWKASETNGTLRLNEQLGYGYDAADNLQLRTNGALVQTFGVDTLNQLSTVTRSGALTLSGATPAPAASVTVNGNAAQTYGDFTFARTNLALVDGTNTFTNIAHNAYGVAVTNLLAVNLPATNAFVYDGDGNLTSDGTHTFVYDAENQLTNVSVAGQWKTEYVYDGLRRKRLTRDYNWQSGAWVKTNETRYLYDRMLVLQERNSNNVVQVTYTRGLDLSLRLQGAGGIGGLLARTDANGSTFYHGDGSGNITSLMDGSQNIVARYEYDPFGKLLGKWGPLADANVYRFSSKEFQHTSGLYAYGYRFYEPNLQRWINRDPLGIRGGINLYQSSYNNPINRIDPFGENPGALLEAASRGSSMLQATGNAEMAAATAEGMALLEGAGAVVGGASLSPEAAAGLGLAGLAGMAAVGYGMTQMEPSPVTYPNPWAGQGLNAAPQSVSGWTGTNGERRDSQGNTVDADGNIVRDKNGNELKKPCNNSKPKLVTNPKHHPNSQSPEPPNVKDLYDKSVLDKNGSRYATDDDGEIHRFSPESNGTSHWNGSTGTDQGLHQNQMPSRETMNQLQ